MRRSGRAGFIRALLLGGGLSLLGSFPLQADVELTERQMIEQLKDVQPRSGTRGLRNLQVEAAEPSEAPSISLLIHFDFDSDRLQGDSHPALQRLARAMNSAELSAARFAIEGHTDAKGSADYNLQLSERRAQSVKRYLIGQGVAPGRLYAVGKGASELANPFEPLAAENRRVRVVNLR